MEWILAIIIIFILFILVHTIITYKKIAQVKRSLIAAQANLDLALKKRWNIIPRIIEYGKKNLKHKRETLEKLIILRNKTYDNMSFAKKQAKDEEIAKLIIELFEESEQNEITEQLTEIANTIKKAAMLYKKNAHEYNRITSKKISQLLMQLTKKSK